MSKKQKQKIQIYKILERYFIIFNILIVILILVFSYLFLIKPKIDLTVSDIKESIHTQQMALNIQRKKLADTQEAIDYFLKIKEEDVGKVLSVLPTKYPKEKLFGEIEDVIIQNGFILSSLSLTDLEDLDPSLLAESIAKSPAIDHLGIIQIQMSVGAVKYANLKQFLKVIERNLPLLDIINLSFASDGEGLSLELRTYYFKP